MMMTRILSISEADWPRLLTLATLNGSKVMWSASRELNDEDIQYYNDWKRFHKINILNAHQLKKLHSQGHYTHEIFNLFKKSKKLAYLEKE